MAFRKVSEYNEEKYGNFFLLRNDGDSAEVVFLYGSLDDVLVADVHYIKSDEYTGYVHCCGKGCPACANDIRIQEKLFIPVYNITEGKIQFFDRSKRFDAQLQEQVFQRFPNPSAYVFTITRHGAARDVNTTYDIRVTGTNSTPLEQILRDNNASLPDYYSVICKEVSSLELSRMLEKHGPSSNGSSYSSTADLPDYSVTPRGTGTNNIPNSTDIPDIPDIPEYSVGTPADVPGEDLPDDVKF